MERYNLTCWKCGKKYVVDSVIITPICPDCGALFEDKKKSVRVGKAVSKWMVAAGIITAILSLWVIPIMFNTVPSILFLFLGILVVFLGLFVRILAKQSR